MRKHLEKKFNFFMLFLIYCSISTSRTRDYKVLTLKPLSTLQNKNVVVLQVLLDR